MRKDKKRHDNKYNFDAGRLRAVVEFYELVSTSDGYGGVGVPTETLRNTTHGALEPVSVTSLSQMQQLGIIGGVSELSSHWYLTIRKQAFVPEKDMIVKTGGIKYVVRGILPLDVPQTFIKILCALSQ